MKNVLKEFLEKFLIKYLEEFLLFPVWNSWWRNYLSHQSSIIIVLTVWKQRFLLDYHRNLAISSRIWGSLFKMESNDWFNDGFFNVATSANFKLFKRIIRNTSEVFFGDTSTSFSTKSSGPYSAVLQEILETFLRCSWGILL